ncbi:hypothetical protein [Streptomyces sp. NPDC002851]
MTSTLTHRPATRRPRAARAAAMGLAAAASISLMGAAAPAATATPSVGADTVAADKVVGKHKYGKWVTAGKTKCRFYIALGVSKKTANAAGSGHCKKKSAQVVVAAVSINNQKIKHTTQRGISKHVYTKAVKLKNPKGEQKICAFGWVNHPLVDSNPKRSEAKVCIKA